MDTLLGGGNMIRCVSLVCLLMFASAFNAFAAAPQLKLGKGRGIVVIAVDGVLPRTTALTAPLDINLPIGWFDKENNRPYMESEFQGLTNTEANFKLVRAPSGRDYLIARAHAGRSAFIKYEDQGRWEICLNKGTYSFYIAEDTYTYLGRFDPSDASAVIEQAIRQGKMPRAVQQHANIPTLLNTRLDGFVPASDSSEERDIVAQDMSELYGSAIALQVGELTPTEFELTDYVDRNGVSTEMCFNWSSKKNRPVGFNGFKE
ncbi:MAG: hypothetical protein QM645_14535 [Asticcacaulis sp.]